jgi:hypothetical protein
VRNANLGRLGLAGLLVVAACGRELGNGGYLLTQAGPPREDSCGLLAEDGSLPGIWLMRTGDEVKLDFDLFGKDGSVRMIGRFKEPLEGEPEEFSADGSISDVAIDVEGASCIVDFGQIHLDATIPEGQSERFEGTLTISEKLVPDQGPGCPLTCKVSVGFVAVKEQ